MTSANLTIQQKKNHFHTLFHKYNPNDENNTTIKQIVNEIVKYQEEDEVFYELYFALSEQQYDLKSALNDLKNKKFEWSLSIFDNLKKQKYEKDQEIENPPEIREGEIECCKCKSKKTITLESQLQRADEGFTYFIHCLNCKYVKKTKNF